MVQVNALNISGAQKPRAYRQEQNQANSAIASDFAGPNEPANPEAYMQWLQQLPGGDKLFRRNSSNTEWIEITTPFFNSSVRTDELSQEIQEVRENSGGVKQTLHIVNSTERRNGAQPPFNLQGNGVREFTGTEITITPSSVDSKILLYGFQTYFWFTSQNVRNGFGATFRRGADGAFLSSRDLTVAHFDESGARLIHGCFNFFTLDLPQTTEPVNYQIWGAFFSAVDDFRVQHLGASSPSNIIAMEVL